MNALSDLQLRVSQKLAAEKEKAKAAVAAEPVPKEEVLSPVKETAPLSQAKWWVVYEEKIKRRWSTLIDTIKRFFS